MPPLEQAEINQLSAQILQELSQTPYACASLTQLSGGTADFVFRGILAQPPPLREDNAATTTTATAKSIIVKHSRDFVAVNRDFPLDVSRCIFEESMLNALITFESTATPDQVSIKTPYLYLFNQETNTQVHEDFPDAVDLKSVFVSPTANDILSQSLSTSIGRALGVWTRSFHTWSSMPAQAGLRAEIGKNEPMRKLKYLVTYDSFIPVLEQFPEIWEDHKKTLESVKELATKQFEKSVGDEGEEDWGIIHGDFWTGNILVPNTQSLDPQKPEGTRLFVIDWELAQFGHRAYDLGQMLGDLYERKHFKDVDGAIWTIEGFLDGYGPLSEDMAFRTAIHAGVHLICWCNRRPQKGPAKGTPEQVTGVVRIGMEFVLKGWEKDRKWFEGSVFASLFNRIR